MSYSMEIVFCQCDPMAQEAKRILAERIAEIELGDEFLTRKLKVDFIYAQSDGYTLFVEDGTVCITAGRTREFIAGAGRLLCLLRRAADEGNALPSVREESIPRYAMRVHYMPAHFGGSFEVAWEGEMQRYLEDLALSSASGYGDWLDPNDMPDPYHPYVFCSTSM
jgi:hypothetical protein